MRERNLETGLEYAGVDLFGLRMRAGRWHVPSWEGAWIWCLRHGDKEAAELIRSRNAPQSDECAYQDHDLCRFGWCRCACHSAVQFELERPLKSLREVQSEVEEMEFA